MCDGLKETPQPDFKHVHYRVGSVAWEFPSCFVFRQIMRIPLPSFRHFVHFQAAKKVLNDIPSSNSKTIPSFRRPKCQNLYPKSNLKVPFPIAPVRGYPQGNCGISLVRALLFNSVFAVETSKGVLCLYVCTYKPACRIKLTSLQGKSDSSSLIS